MQEEHGCTNRVVEAPRRSRDNVSLLPHRAYSCVNACSYQASDTHRSSCACVFVYIIVYGVSQGQRFAHGVASEWKVIHYFRTYNLTCCLPFTEDRQLRGVR